MSKLTKRSLEKKIKALQNYDEACSLAADLYGTECKCDGTLAECFVNGWLNTADMIESGLLNRDDWANVRVYLLADTANMHLVG